MHVGLMGVHVLISGVEQPHFSSLASTFRPVLTDRRCPRPPGRAATSCRTGKHAPFLVFCLCGRVQPLLEERLKKSDNKDWGWRGEMGCGGVDNELS